MIESKNTFESQLNHPEGPGMRQFNHFGNSENDEFFLELPNHDRVPLFKAFSNPIFPLWLQDSNLDLSKLLFSDHENSSLDALTNWRDLCLETPSHILASVELALVKALEFDRAQFQILEKEPTKQNLNEEISRLANHLQVALTLQSGTFYFAESLVDDFLKGELNPLSQLDSSSLSGDGRLDFLAQIGSSLLQDSIPTSELNWQISNPEDLRKTSEAVLKKCDETSRFLLEISRISGHSPEDVLYAFNFIEFIPPRVHGKKEDFNQKEARTMFNESFSRKEGIADFNALIKFLSWLPIEPISSSESGPALPRNYASVRNPTESLKSLIFSHPEIWKNSQEIESFQNQVQTMEMPAAEARALLFVLNNFIKSEFRPKVDQSSHNQLISDINAIVKDRPKKKTLLNNKLNSLIEIENIAQILPEIHAAPFSLISTTDIEEFLQSIEVSMKSIISLNHDTAALDSIRNKIIESSISDKLVNKLLNTFPAGPIIIRSCSSIEDQPRFGMLAGIHESRKVLDPNSESVSAAFKKVLLSMFSQKAVSLRNLKNSPFMPNQFDVVVQPFIQGHGGVLVIKDNNIRFDIATDTFAVTDGETSKIIAVDKKTIHFITKRGRELNDIRGDSIELEFILTPENKLFLVQIKPIPEEVDNLNLLPSNIDLLITIPLDGEVPSETFILDLSKISLNSNQGDIYSFIAKHRSLIAAIKTQPINDTSHLSNILRNLNIPHING